MIIESVPWLPFSPIRVPAPSARRTTFEELCTTDLRELIQVQFQLWWRPDGSSTIAGTIGNQTFRDGCRLAQSIQNLLTPNWIDDVPEHPIPILHGEFVPRAVVARITAGTRQRGRWIAGTEISGYPPFRESGKRIERVRVVDLRSDVGFQVRKDRHKQRRAVLSTGRKDLELIVVVVHGQSNLVQIGTALSPTGRLASVLNSREEQGHQNREDRDGNQEFDQRKGLSHANAIQSGSRNCILRP